VTFHNLPALQVVIPLISAPLCFLLRRATPAWLLSVAVSWICLAISALLLQHVLTVGPVSYHMGGWMPPWGIEYRIDLLNAFVLVLVSGIGAVVLPYARRSVLFEVGNRRAYLFYTAFLLCLTGLLGMTSTGDAFNVFVFLEISSLASYILISMGRDRRALTASFQYLVMGTIGGTFILIAIGFMYISTGTLNMADLARRLPEVTQIRTVQVAFAFFTVGIGLKLAMFPLHLWLPNAYTYAPSAATSFLASTSTKVAIYLLLRFAYDVFGRLFSFHAMPFGPILLVLSSIAIVFASVGAIFQDNIKRMFAYSSVAQIGYITLGIGMATATGLTAGILHLFNHALMKGALFLAIGCIVPRLGSMQVADTAGLGRRMPWTMAAIVIAGLSLVGMPLTVGFVSKWYLVMAALQKGWWWLALLILAGSLLALIYVWRVIEAAYLREPAPGRDLTAIREAPLSMLIPTWILVLANIWFGIDPHLTVGTASRAAAMLMGLGS